MEHSSDTSTGRGWSERADLPRSVRRRLDWYDRQVRATRLRYQALEVTIILVAAAIPATAAAGGDTAIVGVLGAVVAVLAALRGLFGWQHNWLAFSRTLMSLEREVVRFDSRVPPYAGDDASGRLAMKIEDLVQEETAQWAAWTIARGRRPAAEVKPAS